MINELELYRNRIRAFIYDLDKLTANQLFMDNAINEKQQAVREQARDIDEMLRNKDEYGKVERAQIKLLKDIVGLYDAINREMLTINNFIVELTKDVCSKESNKEIAVETIKKRLEEQGLNIKMLLRYVDENSIDFDVYKMLGIERPECMNRSIM